MTDSPDHVVIPAGRLGPEEIMVHEDLLSFTQILGDENRPRPVREGGVSFGKPLIERLSAGTSASRARRSRKTPDYASVLIGFPFDLDELTGSRQYAEAHCNVTLTSPDCLASSLWPVLVTSQDDVERTRTFTVKSDFSFGAATAPSAEVTAKRVYHYAELQPLITSFGLRQARFGWKFEKQEGHPLIPMSRMVFAVLDAPPNTPVISGTLAVDAVVIRRIIGKMSRVQATGRQRPFRLDMTNCALTFLPPDR